MKKQKITIKTLIKNYLILVMVLLLVFQINILVVLADAVPVEEVGENLVENTLTAEMRIPQNNSSVVSNTSSIIQLLAEIMAPVYQLATPGSNLTYDIYRYLMKHTENELGIDKDFFRRMRRQVGAPTVDIVFAPTNPREGERVTAFAIPRGFRNSKEKLYYTWYLVHDESGVGDGSGLDVTAGRDEATGMQARGGYDKMLFGENSTEPDDGDRDAYVAFFGGDDGTGSKEGKATKGSCKGCDCIKNMTMFAGLSGKGCFDDKGELLYKNSDEYDETLRDRGEVPANWGKGVVNTKWITRCYRHNFGFQNNAGNNDGDTYAGRDLIIECHHAFDESLGEDDKTFDSGTEDDLWRTNPKNADTDGDGVIDEADLVGLGQDEFTWIYRKGDKVTVAVEGVSNIPINEGTTDRLRYKNKHWDGEAKNLDLSPTASPEEWYKNARQECEDDKVDCLASTGDSLGYIPVSTRLPTDEQCVHEYSDCMKDLWEHKLRSHNDEDAFGKMGGYYKIMWAAPGICSQADLDKGPSNDWCDEDGDLGFQYLKLYDPVEKGKQLLEVSVSVSPKNPQFSESEEGEKAYSDSTDMILATASVSSDDNVNPDYLYYKWSLWSCDPQDFKTCEDVSDGVVWESRREGIGLRDIGFYPTVELFSKSDKKSLLKIGVVVKRHQSSAMSSPGINGEYTQHITDNESKDNYNDEQEFPNKYAYTASKLIEVTQHKLKIKLYNAKPITGGGWQRGVEICTDGLYKKVCPVYPYQVLAAELDGDTAESVTWKLNGQVIQPSLNNGNNMAPNSKIIFFPIMGTDNQLGRITVIAENPEQNGGIWEDNNIIEERVFSIHRPIVQIDKPKSASFGSVLMRAYDGTQGRYLNWDGRQLWWTKTSKIYNGVSNISKTKVYLSFIPKYISKNADVKFLTVKGYVNGKSIGVAKGNTNFFGQSFSNVIFPAEEDQVSDFKVRLIKRFSDEHRNALQKSFGIKTINELVYDANVKVRAITPEKFSAISGQQVAMTGKDKIGKMFASTIKNAPNYLIFSLRLAVSFVVMAMITFGLVYFGNIKKEDI